MGTVTREDLQHIKGLTDREIQECMFACLYADTFQHGTDGHNRLVLIAKLVRALLDEGVELTPKIYTYDEATRELDITAFVPKDVNPAKVKVIVNAK